MSERQRMRLIRDNWIDVQTTKKKDINSWRSFKKIKSIS